MDLSKFFKVLSSYSMSQNPLRSKNLENPKKNEAEEPLPRLRSITEQVEIFRQELILKKKLQTK